MSTYRSRADQAAANDTGTDQRMMCTAHGCPNLWSTSDGHLCRWHAEAEKHRWPEVTQEQQWGETERARMRGEPETWVAPLTLADKRAILTKLASVFDQKGKDPKAWAKRLRDRENSGERLNERQRTMWRAALAQQSEEVEA